MADDAVKLECADLRRAAEGIAREFPDHGFALLVFTFGERGGISYVSNAQPADMVGQLRAMADRLEGVMPELVMRRAGGRLLN